MSLPVSPVLGQPAGHAVFRVGADDACSGGARFGHGVGHGAALRGDAEHRYVIDVVPKADDAPRARHLHHAGQCAGFGIGLSLQNNLSNLASGLLILIFKPFRAGHVIQVGDVVGSVKSIQFMYTVITTKDQKNVYIPNSLLTSQAVTNIVYTSERVIPFTFDIGYNNDHHEAIKILKNIFAADKRVLNPKNMEIGISEFGDNSVRIAAYARVKSKDFLDVQYSIMSDVKDAFDKYGIDIPYPQRVVYIQNVDTSTGEIKGTKKKATATDVAIDDSLES